MLTDDELRAAYDGADQSTAGWHILGLRAVADAVLAKAIPPGFVVVPAEPTKAMLAAADKIMDCDPRWVARGYRAMIEAAPPPAAPEPSANERRLRRLLCIVKHGRSAYMDDGEAQDSSAHPSIDYLRDSLDEIEAKWRLRASATLTAPEPSEADLPPLPDAYNAGSVGKIVRDPGSQWSYVVSPMYTATQMIQYARAALRAAAAARNTNPA